MVTDLVTPVARVTVVNMITMVTMVMVVTVDVKNSHGVPAGQGRWWIL